MVQQLHSEPEFDCAALVNRCKQIEMRMVRQSYLFWAMFGIIALVCLMAAKRPSAPVESEIFVKFADTEKRAANMIAFEEQGTAGFQLWDKRFVRRVCLCTGQSANEPNLALFDASEKPRGIFHVANDGAGSIAFLDDSGRQRIKLGAFADGRPIFEIHDNEGRIRMMLALDSNGLFEFRQFDSEGDVISRED